MLKHFAILTLVFSATLAQTNNSTSNSTADPLIPTGISQGCSSFLNTLNSDSTLSGCAKTLLSATTQFGPGGNATDKSTSAINSAVDTICSTSSLSSCPDSFFRDKLVDFYSQCSAELTSNSAVIKIYEVVYALIPFRNAICSKDDNDNYCLTQKTNTSTSGAKTYLASQDNSQELLHHLYNDPSLQARAASSWSNITPNMTTFHDTNLLFFFLKPNMTEQDLCTTCTRQVFMCYFNFETLVPFAPGMTASQLLGGQPDLYKGIQNTCGPNFLQTNIQAAGGISGGTLFNSGNPAAHMPGIVTTATLGLATLAIAFVL
ncbi:hypothetical protein M378DRAFT_126504 [Amanita muscaria Koide BX008]|uniref:Uncharacterized protein n=1 Tax=Amanita muscaria (strain Koide BX008) TaxID=946122 RepID=A0A0C2X5V3_AMAMK|nr:hypothetical protein M378DRAFT_126504 [Amanita muscaria Koide BX008]